VTKQTHHFWLQPSEKA